MTVDVNPKSTFTPDPTGTGGAGGGGAGPGVWWHFTPSSTLTGSPAVGQTHIVGPSGGFFSTAQANAYFGVMNQPDYNRLMNATAAFTGQKSPNGSTTQWAWQQAVGYAAAGNAADPKARLTPWDILDRWKKSGKAGGGGSGSGSGPSTTTNSSTSTNVQKLSTTQAQGMISQALEALNGHAPSDSDLSAFISQFNAASKADPQITRSTSTTHSSGSHSSTSSSSTSSGGVDPNVIAEQYAKSRPDYAEYQTAVPLMDAFMSALKSPTGGGF